MCFRQVIKSSNGGFLLQSWAELRCKPSGLGLSDIFLDIFSIIYEVTQFSQGFYVMIKTTAVTVSGLFGVMRLTSSIMLNPGFNDLLGYFVTNKEFWMFGGPFLWEILINGAKYARALWGMFKRLTKHMVQYHLLFHIGALFEIANFPFLNIKRRTDFSILSQKPLPSAEWKNKIKLYKYA